MPDAALRPRSQLPREYSVTPARNALHQTASLRNNAATRLVPADTHWDFPDMDASINNTVNTALALQDVNLNQEIQARVLKKALNAQADTALTLMQSLPVLAVDATLGSRIDTHA